MIKFYANKHDPANKASVEAGGSVGEIVDDIGNLAHTLYFSLMEQGPELAEAFKEATMLIFADNGTVWMPTEELLGVDDG